jgi:hypothetical protein
MWLSESSRTGPGWGGPWAVRRTCGAPNTAFRGALDVRVIRLRALQRRRTREISMTFDAYYTLRPLIPRWMQIKVRRRIALRIHRRHRDRWPISEATAGLPPSWPGWPDGKRFAVVLTHDVEHHAGLARCEALAALEEERGLRAAFGFVPLRYETPERLRRTIADRGLEVMIHDLYHDGKLYPNLYNFAHRRETINGFLERWETRGFSSGSMHHNLPWISQLNIDYSVSTNDVDPFEPQACGLGRIFPCWVQSPDGEGRGFVEMPYTLPQDFTLFVLLGEQSNAIWRRKLDWIAARGGMALIKTHPDYMVFSNERKPVDGYPVELYTDLLDYLGERYGDEAWFAQPSEVARYWRGLRPADGESANTIAWRETLCASCRRAHAAGWLREFRPRHGVKTARETSPASEVVKD